MSRAERRLRRRHEQRGKVVVGWTPPTLPKMSVTIRDFAAPLLATVPVKAGIDAWFFELNLAALIWNGINRGMDRAALVRELMAFVPERDVGSIVDELMRRKADAFPRDRRCVLELEAYESSGRYEVMALSQRS